MDAWILCRKNEDDTYTGVGVALSEDAAKGIAADGDFLIIPVTMGTAYADIINPGLPGAVTYSVEGLSNLVAQAKQSINNLRSDIQDLQAELTDFKALATTKFLTLQADVSGIGTDMVSVQDGLMTINGQISDLEARVTTLEGG